MQNEDYGHFDEPRGTEDIDLAQFDDDFAHAEVEEREFETIPDGKAAWSAGNRRKFTNCCGHRAIESKCARGLTRRYRRL